MAVIAFFCQLLLMQKLRMRFLGCGEIFPDPLWRMRPHFHPFHEVIVVKSGAMLLKTRHGEFMAHSGDVLFYEAGLVHEEISQSSNPVGTRYLSFEADHLLPDFPLYMQDPEGRLIEMLGWMLRDQQKGRPLADCFALLETIVRELLWTRAQPNDVWLEKVRDHLRVSFTSKLRLADVANFAGMSRFAFVRKFKRLSGLTPMQELKEIRLREARNLLLSSDLPMKAIADQVGIGDEFQLSKQFRRQFGVSPSQLRGRPLKLDS